MKNFFLFACVAFLALACKSDKSKEMQTEETAEVQTTEEKDVLALGDVQGKDVYDLSTGTIYWTGSKPIGDKHLGTVAIKEGKIGVTDGQLVGGEFIIDMTSISSTDLEGEMKEKLDGHLKNEDFFEVDSYPLGKFVITGIEEVEGEEDVTHHLTGNLTVKDVTKPVTVPASVLVREDKVSIVSKKFEIDRTEWNVKFNSGKFFEDLKDKLINDEINLNVNVEAMK